MLHFLYDTLQNYIYTSTTTCSQVKMPANFPKKNQNLQKS